VLDVSHDADDTRRSRIDAAFDDSEETVLRHKVVADGSGALGHAKNRPVVGSDGHHGILGEDSLMGAVKRADPKVDDASPSVW